MYFHGGREISELIVQRCRV